MKTSLGTWITLNHPSIVEILADSGFDWLCIDMEHSVTDYFEAQQQRGSQYNLSLPLLVFYFLF